MSISFSIAWPCWILRFCLIVSKSACNLQLITAGAGDVEPQGRRSPSGPGPQACPMWKHLEGKGEQRFKVFLSSSCVGVVEVPGLIWSVPLSNPVPNLKSTMLWISSRKAATCRYVFSGSVALSRFSSIASTFSTAATTLASNLEAAVLLSADPTRSRKTSSWDQDQDQDQPEN